ncbi:IclR family transcriptional regulator [Ottowia sp. VDI28]|uniref:IclR family transcriptional regulator n=1 Tax=Ottowia sp. VDI28 TaxID=3133968 RepID=UPI003C2F9C6B
MKKNWQTATDADPRLFIGSIAKCFQMLEALNTASRAAGLTELARLSGLDRSSAQRITHTLRALGYLKQDPVNKTFRLSGRMLEFGYTVLSTNELRERAAPHLEELNRRTGETVNLMELESDEIVYVARYPSRHAVSVDLHVGSRLPAFCSAAGRAILSQLEPADAMTRLKNVHRAAMTARTVTDLAALSRLLAEARQQGFALNDQEAFIGDISVAAPLLTADGKVLAAVNIAVPWPRWQLEDVLARLVPLLLRTTKAINRDIRFL